MTKIDIIERINELENFILSINMKKDWKFEDHCAVEEWRTEINTLKKILKRMKSK